MFRELFQSFGELLDSFIPLTGKMCYEFVRVMLEVYESRDIQVRLWLYQRKRYFGW